MKTLKRIACSFLVLTMLTGLTSCAAKTFDHKKAVKYCEDENYEMYDNADDYSDVFEEIILGEHPGEGAYIHADKNEAQEVYDLVFNRFDAYPSCDVNEATSFIFFDKGVFIQGYVLTFDEAKDAEKIFKNYSKRNKEFGEKGEEKGYSYFIIEKKYSDNLKQYIGVYLKNNTVFQIQCNSKKSALVEEICGLYGVIPPSEA